MARISRNGLHEDKHRKFLGLRRPCAVAVVAALSAGASVSAVAQQDDANAADENSQKAQSDDGRTRVAVADDSSKAKVFSLDNWEEDDLYHGWRADELLEADVIDASGEDVGDVADLVFNEQGQMVAVIAEVGGFLDIGDTHVAIPWTELKILEDESIRIPLTQEKVEDYSLFDEDVFSKVDVGKITTVEDDVTTGPKLWQATELRNDYVVMQNGEGYGYITDLIISREGKLQAVIANAVSDDFPRGNFAYPWLGYGYPYAWDSGLDYYVLPYSVDQIAGRTVFDFDAMD
jgi:sporulation protein YlmC with PRC-barrel domain